MTVPFDSGTPGESQPSIGGVPYRPRTGLLGTSPTNYLGLLRQQPDVTAVPDVNRPPQIGPSRQQEPWIDTARYWMQNTPWFQRMLTGLSALSQGALPEEEAPLAAEKMLAKIPDAERQIVGPALRLGGRVYTSEWPESHVHVLAKAQADFLARDKAAGLPDRQHLDSYYKTLSAAKPEDEGFVLDNGRYVNREEAHSIAEWNGQLLPDRFERNRSEEGQLHSLDVKGALPRPTIKPTVPMVSARAPNADAAAVAQAYGQRSAPISKLEQIDPVAGRRMSDAYDALKSDPHDPEVQRRYALFNQEVDQQYKAITDAGYKIQFVDKDPYKNSAEMMKDVRENRTLKVFRTADDAAHPILTNDQNNKFRAVHDFFGHAVEGNQFGPGGEERAYRAHAPMFSDEARPVLATETRGQNSWYNFGPHADKPVGERPFAQQKAALFPEHLTGEYPEPKQTFSPLKRAPLQTFSSEDIKLPPKAPEVLGAAKTVSGRMQQYGLPTQDVTGLAYGLAHHLADAPDRPSFLARVAAEEPGIAPLIQRHPEVGDRLYAAANAHRNFVQNELKTPDEIRGLMEKGGPGWDKWYGPYYGALKSAGLDDETAGRVLRTSSILSTRKSPDEEVRTALQVWDAHEHGEPITNATTEHTNDLTRAARKQIQGEPWSTREEERKEPLARQKTSNYILSELTGGRGDAPTMDTWHARAYLKNLDKFLDKNGSLSLTDARWNVLQGRTLADARKAGLNPGDFQARVWGGITGYTPKAGETGANRLDLLRKHLPNFPRLLERYPGLRRLIQEEPPRRGLLK